MKKLIGLLLGSIILGAVIMLILGAISWFIDWVCLDNGRYILAMVIIGYIVKRLIMEELDM